jgi:hypothetical protein
LNLNGVDENYEIDVTHNTGYDVYIKGALIEPGDHVAFVRKDMALDGTDTNITSGVLDDNDAHNCAQAEVGTLPVSSIGADDTVNDYGGEVRRECLTTANGCDPTDCTVYPENIIDNPNYHEDCRFASEFNMLGVQDTVSDLRKPWEPIEAAAPGAPPWHDYLDDTHYDNGGTDPSLVAGVGRLDQTYDESGTYYLCYRQDRDSTFPGYGALTFLKYIVVHVRPFLFGTLPVHPPPYPQGLTRAVLIVCADPPQTTVCRRDT